MNARDILTSELIGKDIEIMEAKNKSLLGLKGKVIDETKNTITIIRDGKKKMILKQNIKMAVKMNGKKILVDGKLLARRPEDRLQARGI